MKKNIKWLVGLIAIFVIVFIVAKLLNPFTSGPIGNKAKKAFSSNIEEVVEIIKEKIKNDKNFDATKITEKNIEKYLNISGDNFKSVKITIENDEVQIVIVGQNEWEDLVASGDLEETKVVKTEEYDNEAPVMTLKGEDNLNVELGNTYTELGATAEDNKDGDITNEIEISGMVDTGIVDKYIITYTVKDSVGNETIKTRKVNVVDTTAPIITLNGQSSIAIEVGDTYTELGATVLDNSGDLTEDIEIIGTVNKDKLGTYKIIYTVKDNSDNESAKTRTINVVDTTKPVLTLKGSKIVTVEVGSTYEDMGATALDNYDSNLTETITILNTVNTNVLGQYTITYNVKDNANNQANTISRVVNVVDTTKPVITLNGNNLVNIEAGTLYNDPGVTVLDNYDGKISNIEVVSTLNTNAVGEYTITYNAKDKKGNIAITAVRVVKVVDTTKPVITLLGDEEITLEVGSTYEDMGATALDNKDGNVTDDIEIISNVNIEVLGTYTVTYNVKDSNNNIATTVARTVNVVDTTKPVITLLGDEEITLEIESEYEDSGATASDNYDGNITEDIEVVSTLNANVVGEYTVTYSVKDNNNNTATIITRTINVIDSGLGKIYIPSSITYDYTSADTDITPSNDDEGYATINLGFNILFGEETYSSLNVGVNGWMTLSSTYTNLGYDNLNIADDDVTVPTIAVFWDDLVFNRTVEPTSGLYYSTGIEGGKNYVLIEYRKVFAYSGQSAGQDGSFEVKLYDDGTIKLSYNDVNFGDESNVDKGIGATVGVYANSTNYAQTGYNQAALNNNTTIQYSLKRGSVAPHIAVLAPDSCYTFNSSTKTITGYDSNCTKRLIISSTIGGVTVENIGGQAFQWGLLKQVEIPSTVKSIEFNAFQYNSITTAVIQSGVTTIGTNAFAHNQLVSITIPSSVTTIGTSAFAYNQLTSATIPSSVTTIGDSAFYSNQLPSITIPGSITSIGIEIFNTNQLTSITIPDSITSIGRGAFANNQLTGVTIPSSVTTIGESAFTNNKLASITIPSSITSIGKSAFNNNLLPDNQAFIMGRTTGGASTSDLVSYGGAKINEVVIPSDVTTIGNNAFINSQLTSVTIPSSVTTIGNYAFGTNQLTSVTIPSSVTTIGESAFTNNKLTSATITNGVTNIGNSAFSNNLLTSIAIPNSVTNIGTQAFRFNKIPDGSATIDRAAGSVTVGSNAFAYNGINSNITISLRYLR